MIKKLSNGIGKMRVALPAALILMFAPIAAQSAERLVVQDNSSNTKMVITDEGYIGIGTTTPQAQIDLGGGTITVNGTDVTGENAPGLKWVQTGRLDFGFGGSGGGNVEVYGKGRADDRKGQFRFIYGGGAYGEIQFIHYNGSSWGLPKMVLDRNGRLDMAGGAYCNGSSWINASSREYKKDIKELTGEEALDTLNSLSPVKFSYKNDPQGENYVGFIAEDVPDLVATKDRKGMSSMDVVAVLTKALQEQQKTIAALTEEMAELKKQLPGKDN